MTSEADRQAGDVGVPAASPPKILVVIGTRPEAIKMVPVVLALREHADYEPVLISTGQHHRMVDEVLALAGVQPDVELWAHGRQGRLNELVTSVMRRLDDFCDEEFGIGAGELATWQQVRDGKRPAAMLVHGDTSSSMAAALAAFNLRIPVVHVEAGLRTNDTLHPFPEEMNRQLIGCLAAFHLAPTSEAVGISLIVAIVLAIADGIPFWDTDDLWQLLFFYALCFGGVIVGCVARGMAWGPAGALRGVLIAQVYAFYSWILWPVLVRSAYRQAASRRGWAKTRREVVS